jgi:hypothetical protein
MLDFWTGLAVSLIVIAMGILYWGFRPQIGSYFKEKRNLQEGKAETVTATRQGTELTSVNQLAPLPNEAQITKLNIDNSLLDEIYEQAQRKAIDIFHDARFSYFTIQVHPYEKLGHANICLTFYSQWANKLCEFVSYDRNQQAKHVPPDKRAIGILGKQAFITIPWKESPQWLQFIERAYARIEPLTPARNTRYHLSAYLSSDVLGWSLGFEDGFSGREHRFTWNGKGFDEGSIVQVY